MFLLVSGRLEMLFLAESSRVPQIDGVPKWLEVRPEEQMDWAAILVFVQLNVGRPMGG